MKTCVRNRFALSVLAAALGLVSVDELTGQTFKALATNVTPVIVSGNTIYGFGNSGSGTIVALNTDGTGLRTLYAFTPGNPTGLFTNSDGKAPSGLTLSGSTLYGSCSIGGSSGNGTLFKLNTDGTGFTVLYTFADINSDGYRPSPLILSGGTLYGTTAGSPVASNAGTVFAVGTDGSGFTTLYTFSPPDPSTGINSGGAYLNEIPLTLSGATLYGVTQTGGTWGRGTVFAVNTDGTGFATLHSFTAVASTGCPFTTGPNSDGANPQNAGLVLSSNTLYGTAYYGGGFGNGTVFAQKTDGTGFTVLHNFSSYVNCTNSLINADGGNPRYTLVLSGNTLYGTTLYGGSSGRGVVFAVNTDATAFTNLHNGLTSSLIGSGKNLYGGFFSSGTYTLFSIALPIVQPQLSIVPAGANVVLSWPANVTGFTLQSTTDLASPLWTTNSAAPVVVNGQYTVTNPISGAQQFFRLGQ